MRKDEEIRYLSLQAEPQKGYAYDRFLKSLDICRPAFDGLHQGFHDARLSSVDIRVLADLFKEHLKWGTPKMFEKALMPFLDKVAGPLTIRRMLMRVVANREILMKAGELPSWQGVPPLWIYAEVLDCGIYRDPRTQDVLASCKFLAGDGVTAGSVYFFRLTTRYVKWLMKEIGGCPKYEACSVQEFTGMRLNLQLGINSNKRFYILEAEAASAQRTHNRMLRRSREEHKNPQTGKPCNVFSNCWACPRGRQECGLSCREFPRNNNATDEKTRLGEVVQRREGHSELVPAGDQGVDNHDGKPAEARGAAGDVRAGKAPGGG